MQRRSFLGLAVVSAAMATTMLFSDGPRSAAAGDAEIAGVEWRWLGTQLNDDTTFTPSDPSRYTLTLRADGRAAIRADCNVGNGPYTIADGGIDLGPFAVTRAACPPGSLSDVYLRQLDSVTSYFILNGDLILELPFDSGSMRFARTPAMDATPAAPSAVSAVVTGVVTYLERIALPADAVVTVRIEDTSRADAPAVIVGEQVITQHGQVPIPFAVSYDATQISAQGRYTLRARIESADGRLLFINTRAYPVITGGNPTSDIEVSVSRAG